MTRPIRRWTLRVASGVVAVLGAADAQSWPTPQPARMEPAPLAPSILARADVNGDGRIDAVAASASTPAMAAVLALAAPGTQLAPAAALSAVPTDLAMADFDGDGRADAAAASSTGEVLLGLGTGAFAPGVVLSQAVTPISLAAADLDSDGLADLVESTGTTNSVVVLRNGPGLTFSPILTLTTPSAAGEISIADFNKDGQLDFVVALPAQKIVRVYLGTAGGFSSPLATSSVHCDRTLAADLDADGAADLVGTSAPFEAISFLKNSGIGSFTTLSFAPGFGGQPAGCSAADFDGDGRLDIAVTRPGQSDVRVYFTGGGVFPVWSIDHSLSIPSNEVIGVDFSADGIVDLVCGTNAAVNFLEVIPSLSLVQVPLPASPRTFALGDLNRDGRFDTVSALEAAGALGIGLQQSPSGFAATTLLNASSGASSVSVADFNRDGSLDVLAAGSAGVRIFSGNGTGSLAPGPSWSVGAPFVDIAAADFNGDGRADWVGASAFNSGSLAFASGDGFGGFAAPAWVTSPFGAPAALAISDLNLDGTTDIAAATPGTYEVFFGGAAGLQFAAGGSAVTSTTHSLAAADVNLDGRPDLVVAEPSLLSIHLQQGATPAWSLLATVPIGSHSLPNPGPPTVAVGDWNGDGLQDLAATHSESAIAGAQPTGLSISTQIGSLSFTQTLELVPGRPLASLRVADLGLDGRIDLLAASGPLRTIVVIPDLQIPSPGAAQFGAGTGGCMGSLAMAAVSPPAINNLGFAVRATQVPPMNLGVGILCDAQDVAGSDPLFLGILLHVGLFQATQLFAIDAVSDASGIGRMAMPIGNLPQLVGVTAYLQSIWLAPPALCTPSLFGLISSRGLSITFQQ
ncbi:MAG: VCBS repeat-containing protein [Planctomycetes bacterium]|nr:VCBS repeat-containing protein [Planctomycetota bacterium]